MTKEQQKQIFILKGNTPQRRWMEIASDDMRALQFVLTIWLRGGGNGFIHKMNY